MQDKRDDAVSVVTSDPPSWTKLDPLGPHYEPASHSSYLRAMLEGIESGQVRNLALSGPYGAGKSSILEGLKQRYSSQTLQISLSTVRPAGQVGAEDQREKPSATDLQKEIVKQILYVIDPSKTPASRFPRTSKFRWGRSLLWAVVAGAVGVAVQCLITVMVALFQQDVSLSWDPSAYVPTFVAASVLVYLLLRVTNGRVSISDLSAGPAKLTLTDTSGSYFDDYLDEIVYFFQASKKRILILEDMDRFNNIEVVEDLRALNVLLNHAAQLQATRLHGSDRWLNRALRRRPWTTPAPLDYAKLPTLDKVPPGFHDGPIIFVYAIRDSLLTETVKATNEAHHDAFTRTKFFDLIVPVVPFVTEQNARGALKTELERLVGSHNGDAQGSQRPSDDLVRSIAQFFPDQRQIRNIRNEFAMYRDRLLQPGAHPVEMTPDRLLALILYKNLHVADFELIRLGNSKLHYVLRLAQDLVAENLERINGRLSHPSEESQQALARDLAEHLAKRAALLNITFQELRNRSYQALTQDMLADLDRWRSIAAGDTLYYNSGHTLDRESIETAFDVSLDFAETATDSLTPGRRAQLIADRKVLEQATWVRLWQAPEFVLSASSAAWADEDRPTGDRSFAQIVNAILGEGLAADLIAAGHLTKNFALLSAHFDVRFLSIEALDFAASVTEAHGRRPLVSVSEQAIREVLQEHSTAVLERSGMVNIHVLEYVLRNQPEEARRILAQLRAWTEEDQTFLRDFFTRYGDSLAQEGLVQVIQYLTRLAPDVVSFVVTDSSVPNESRVALFEHALQNVPGGELPASVSANETVRRYAQDVHASLESLTREDSNALAAAHCLVALHTNIYDLRPLSVPVRELLVPRALFELSVANLRVIVGSPELRWVSLECLRSFPDAYQVILDNVHDYLALEAEQELEPTAQSECPTADTASGLALVLTDLCARGLPEDETNDLLQTVARRAEPSLLLNEIQDLDAQVQEALLLEDRVAHTIENLVSRFKSAGGRVTLGIATVISRDTEPEITTISGISPFANTVVNATREFPELLSPDVTSSLLRHLQDCIDIDINDMLSAEPEVVVRLINDGWGTRDDLWSAATVELDWSIREILIAGDPVPEVDEVRALLLPEDTPAFLNSRLISVGVRNYAHLMLDTLLGGAGKANNARIIARHIQREETGVSLTEVHELARAGAPREALVALLTREPARTEFRSSPAPTLTLLGGPYASIVSLSAGKSPTFPPTPEHEAFLALLAEAGTIRRRAPIRDGKLRIMRMARS